MAPLLNQMDNVWKVQGQLTFFFAKSSKNRAFLRVFSKPPPKASQVKFENRWGHSVRMVLIIWFNNGLYWFKFESSRKKEHLANFA